MEKTVRYAAHPTLMAGVEDVITIENQPGYDRVEIVNRNGAGEIFYTLDGTEAVVEGDDMRTLPATAGASRVHPVSTVAFNEDGSYSVRIVSATGTAYTVSQLTR